MISRIDALAYRCALARAVVGVTAVAAAFGATGYKLGRDAGRIEGRAAAFRQTEQVLHDLERALAPLVQQQAPTQPDNGRVD